MLRRGGANGYLIHLAASICATITLILGCVDFGKWHIRDFQDGRFAAAKSSSHFHRGGVSGQRYQLGPRRDTPCLPSLVSAQIKGHSLPVAPLTRPDGRRYPICEVWAVITTINSPSKVVHQLSNITGTCICIVADEKSPLSYDVKGDNVVYLTPEMQVRISFSVSGEISNKNAPHTDDAYSYLILYRNRYPTAS